MSLTILVGPPGTGKSKAIRDRFLKASPHAVFFDGRHNREAVRQLRHEMGYFDHHYLFCSPGALEPELAQLDGSKEIFIDMPELSGRELQEIRRLAEEKNYRLTLTATAVPEGFEDAEIIQI